MYIDCLFFFILNLWIIIFLLYDKIKPLLIRKNLLYFFIVNFILFIIELFILIDYQLIHIFYHSKINILQKVLTISLSFILFYFILKYEKNRLKNDLKFINDIVLIAYIMACSYLQFIIMLNCFN